MARLSRIVVPGYPHHVTQRGVRSMDVFHWELDRREYLGMRGEEIARYGVAILVWWSHDRSCPFCCRTSSRDLARGRSFEETSTGNTDGAAGGDAAFLAIVEKLTGRDLSKGRPGRPRKRSL
jgi:putative transposase